MKPLVVLSGQKWLGCEVLALLLSMHWRVVAVAAPNDDRLQHMALQHNIATGSPANLELLLPPHGADLLICADHRDFLSKATREKFALGALAFHGSFLPRHRGGSSVEWTIRFRDPIAGASIYWMDDGMDTGPIAAREAVMVSPGESAAELWRRAIAPTGLKLFSQVLTDIEAGRIVRTPQEEIGATWEPTLKKTT